MQNIFSKIFSVKKFFMSSGALPENLNSVAPSKNRPDFQDIKETFGDKYSDNPAQLEQWQLLEQIASEAAVQQEAEEAAQNLVDNPYVTPEVQVDAQDLMDTYKQEKQAIQQDTFTSLGTIENQYAKKTKLDIKFNEDGRITTDSLVLLMSDADQNNKVQINNRSFIERLFNGMKVLNAQNFGEQQIAAAMSGMSRTELEWFFERIAGEKLMNMGASNMYVEETQVLSKDWPERTVSVRNPEINRQMKKFHENLQADLANTANIMQMISGQADLGTGLMTVIRGDYENAFAQLQQPEKQKEIQEMLKSGKIWQEDIPRWQSAVDFLLKIGLSGTAAVLSGGVMNLKMESAQNTVPKEWGKKSWLSKENLRASKSLGEAGSVAANVDIAGLTLEANINKDHAAILRNTNVLMANPDKAQAVKNVIEYAEKISQNPEKIKHLIQKYQEGNDKILKLQLNTPEQEALRNSKMAEWAHAFMSSVLQANGVDFKGAYATLGLTAWVAWLSFNRTETGGTINGVNEKSAEVEAGLNKRNISDKEVVDKLARYNIKPNENGNYVLNGQEIVLGPNQKIQWQLIETFDIMKSTLTPSYRIVDVSDRVTVTNEIIQIQLQNIKEVNAYIAEKPGAVANFLLRIRGRLTDVQDLIVKENYSEASTLLRDILSKDGDPISQRLLVELNDIQAIEDKATKDFKLQVFMDEVLAKTSGGKMSREDADRIEKWENATDIIKKYYTAWENKILNAFANQYGIEDKVALKGIVDNIADTASKANKSTLGAVAWENGFMALVAYSQINGGKRGLKALDRVRSAHATVIGTSQEVTDKAILDSIRTKMKDNISDAEIKYMQQTNKVLEGKTAEEIKDIMTSGKIKAYLSFEPEAECFNLGFMVEPGTVETTTEHRKPVKFDNTISQGGTVLHTTSNSMTIGIGGGQEYNKQKAVDKTNDSTSTTPENPGTPINSTEAQTHMTWNLTKEMISWEATTNAVNQFAEGFGEATKWVPGI